jgi:hypothetical protein
MDGGNMAFPPLAASGGGMIFLVVILVLVVAVAFGYYTRKGSGINQHPQGAERSGSPGVGEGASRIANAEDETEGQINTHGTG